MTLPASGQEARSPEYETAGLYGCIGSMDATHVLCEKIPHDMKQVHSGFKLAGTARTYNLVVNHQRRILCSTKGHPGRWNDKTLVLFDELATALKDGTNTELDSLPFFLYERDPETKAIRKQEYKVQGRLANRRQWLLELVLHRSSIQVLGLSRRDPVQSLVGSATERR